MEFFKRLFGICKTQPPLDKNAWKIQDNRVEIELSKMPELSENGGAVRLEGKGLSSRLLVFRGEDGVLRSLENRCAHMGRRIDVLPDSKKLQCCSVGKTAYDYSGNPLSGPAKNSLSVFMVEEGTASAVILLKS